jgi:hypothetical protein
MQTYSSQVAAWMVRMESNLARGNTLMEDLNNRCTLFIQVSSVSKSIHSPLLSTLAICCHVLVANFLFNALLLGVQSAFLSCFGVHIFCFIPRYFIFFGMQCLLFADNIVVMFWGQIFCFLTNYLVCRTYNIVFMFLGCTLSVLCPIIIYFIYLFFFFLCPGCVSCLQHCRHDKVADFLFFA